MRQRGRQRPGLPGRPPGGGPGAGLRLPGGAYSPGPKDRPVDESRPTHGWPTGGYTREKAYVERLLDAFERRHPEVRVVRLRPGLIFKRASASQQRRLFAGPLLPNRLVRRDLVPVVPDTPALRRP